MTDPELERMRAMTIAELFAPPTPWETMEKALALIIAEADEIYRESLGLEFDCRLMTLALAAYAFSPQGIDSNAVGNMVTEMALLAHALLQQEEEAVQWDARTQEALRMIRRADPEIGQAFDPLTPTVSPTCATREDTMRTPRDIEFNAKMLADAEVRCKLVDWAVEIARGQDRLSAINAAHRVAMTWRDSITQEVIDELERQKNDEVFRSL
jgi:hypothetical protein